MTLHTIPGFDRIGEENAFAVLARAAELQANGKDVINLGIGQPDFPTPPHIVEAAVKALHDGHHGYTPATGLPVLREAVAAVPDISLTLDAEKVVMRYERVQDLLRELKALGAHNVNQQRPAGLTGRARLRGMLAAYEGSRDGGLVPATYDVLYGTLERQ